jgi:hypothetical protein
VLFDPFATLNSGDVFAPPCTSPTALDTGDESGQDCQALLAPEPCAAPPIASARLADLPASPDQPDQPEVPTFDLPTNGGQTVAPPSADGDLAPIVSPLVAFTRLGFSDEPGAEDHVYTPADMVVGPAARFEANVAAVVALKALGAESRPATSEERTILARFSGFGDSTFGINLKPSNGSVRLLLLFGARCLCALSSRTHAASTRH